jgi:hypothetical protein
MTQGRRLLGLLTHVIKMFCGEELELTFMSDKLLIVKKEAVYRRITNYCKTGGCRQISV